MSDHTPATSPPHTDADASGKRSWRDYLHEPVSPAWGDAVLLLGCLATGLLDAAVFNVWSCFVSMQTGNTVYVGLGMSGQPLSQPLRWVKSGTSILSFMLGSFLFSRLMRYISSPSTPLARLSMLLATLLQALLTALSALLAARLPRDAGDRLPGDLRVLVPLALLAAQSGGQCVLSRVLGYGELPTVVLTSGYCDLAMDEKVFRWDNAKRNRRVGAMVAIVGGAAVGGVMTKHGGIVGALWVVTGLKGLMALAWVFWRADRVRLP